MNQSLHLNIFPNKQKKTNFLSKADAIEKLSQELLYHLAAEARNIKKQIECLDL